ncbi:hypothetical protein BC835DRAFT_1306507 [Cytidiella melzeri]|nr:hypothetical protein BC835DRAFT_1306507 [Cytidiella melzeri]
MASFRRTGIKALSHTTGGSSSKVTSVPAITPSVGLGDLHAELTNSEPTVSIPWTISNKYYTADVHFELRQLQGFAGYLASDVPAVVYIWCHGDQYKTEVPELARKLCQYDPEVSLAVRFASDDLSLPGDSEDILDDFISSHGFEYINGERGKRQPTEDGSSSTDDDAAGVPGLPRVIDALSTIMWPSMVQTQRTTQRKTRAGGLLDWASMEDASGTGGGAQLLQNRDANAKDKMQKEMDELESWLQKDFDIGQGSRADPARKDYNNPWSTDHDHEVDLDYEHKHGFEDDFDDFVGAPMDVTYGDSRHSKQSRVPSSSSSAPQRAFTTDFVLNGTKAVHVDNEDFDDDDPDMPSRAEIEEMSQRLFGSASLNIPPTSPSWQRLHSPIAYSSSGDLLSGDGGTIARTHTQTPHEPGDSGLALNLDGDEGEGDGFEMCAFDLSRVLGALQGMKEQIAGMDDEGERRKAAAKVALGLVYGLQKEDERDRGAAEGTGEEAPARVHVLARIVSKKVNQADAGKTGEKATARVVSVSAHELHLVSGLSVGIALTARSALTTPETAGTDDLHISPQANLVKRLGAELKVPGTVKEIQAEIESLGEGEGAPAAGAHSHTKRLGLVMKVMPNVRKGSSQGNDGISAAEADLQRLAAKGAEEVKGKEEKKEGKAPSDEGGNKL